VAFRGGRHVPTDTGRNQNVPDRVLRAMDARAPLSLRRSLSGWLRLRAVGVPRSSFGGRSACSGRSCSSDCTATIRPPKTRAVKTLALEKIGMRTAVRRDGVKRRVRWRVILRNRDVLDADCDAFVYRCDQAVRGAE